MNRRLSAIRPVYQFDVSCQRSVPEAIIAFLESENFEDAVRKAISIGGDGDMTACIAGSIAEAFYKEIPAEIIMEVNQRLPGDLREIVERFAMNTNSDNNYKKQSNNDDLENLFEAYLQTDYIISDESVNLTLRVNEKNSELDSLLTMYQTNSAAFLTAYNPYSKPLSQVENEKRQETLVSILKEKGYILFKGFGQGRTGNWQPEPSVMIMGINFQTALEFARQFEQNAFIFLEKSKSPKLIKSR